MRDADSTVLFGFLSFTLAFRLTCPSRLFSFPPRGRRSATHNFLEAKPPPPPPLHYFERLVASLSCPLLQATRSIGNRTCWVFSRSPLPWARASYLILSSFPPVLPPEKEAGADSPRVAAILPALHLHSVPDRFFFLPVSPRSCAFLPAFPSAKKGWRRSLLASGFTPSNAPLLHG